MFVFMTKKAYAAEIKTLTDARDGLVDCLNRAERQNQELTAKLRDALEDVDALTAGTAAMKNRITNMQKDIDRLEAEVERMRPIVEKAERRREMALANLKQNKGRGK